MVNTLLAVLLLAALCAFLGCAVVLPLWKWAVSSPGTYSAAVAVLAALLVLALLVRACKKHGARVFFRRFLKCTVVAGGLAAAVSVSAGAAAFCSPCSTVRRIRAGGHCFQKIQALPGTVRETDSIIRQGECACGAACTSSSSAVPCSAPLRCCMPRTSPTPKFPGLPHAIFSLPNTRMTCRMQARPSSGEAPRCRASTPTAHRRETQFFPWPRAVPYRRKRLPQ